MSISFRSFTRPILAVSALAAAAGLGAVFAQQMPASKVTPVMKQTLADIPGREVLMITIDIPPGGGSAPHRHPGHHHAHPAARRAGRCVVPPALA